MSPAFAAISIFALLGAVAAIEPYEIQGNTWISPYHNQTVTGIHGIVSAKGPQGYWITSKTPDDDPATSDAVYVFLGKNSTLAGTVATGDEVQFDAKVQEYRADATDPYLTEIIGTTIQNFVKLSSANTVTPIVLGTDRNPPTQEFSKIDHEHGGVLGYPNNVSTLSGTNDVLEPEKYGLDFWASLDGQLVTVKKPVAIGYDTQFREFYAYGDWPVTGKNSRGGLTMNMDSNGIVDANPEAILIGAALDGSKNPATVIMGTTFEDITGIVTFAFHTWRILPLTAPKLIAFPSEKPHASTLKSIPLDSTGCQSLTFGGYNVENLAPTSKHLPGVADHLVNYMNNPDVLFIQEVQDNSGPTDDGVVDSTETLDALTGAIQKAGGPSYSYAVVDPANNQDGGSPGGNIRVAFLYRPEVVQLVNPKQGGAYNASSVQIVDGKAQLTLNPGRIDPSNPSYVGSRKPLAVQFQVVATKDMFYAVNVHQSSKGGSTPIQGDARPQFNSKLEDRIGQNKAVATFISEILKADPEANVIVAGDFNEFLFTTPAFEMFHDMVEDADVVVNTDPLERYSYSFEMNAQQLDHILVSQAVAQTLEFEHIRVNSWASSYESRVSDHDPSVGRFKVCGNGGTLPPTVSSVTSASITNSPATSSFVDTHSSTSIGSSSTSLIPTTATSSQPAQSSNPSTICSYQIGHWCAAPLPKFDDLPTCLKSASVCLRDNLYCWSKLHYPTVLRCSEHALKCANDQTYCRKNCLAKGGQCGPSFP